MLLAGPTASGKSSLAIEIAQRLGGTVVNADSMQVYHDLRVLTARPSEEDEQRVPHRLYGHRDGAELYSVGQWLRDVERTLQEIDGLPIITGGTGLYFSALEDGLVEVPDIPPEVRAHWRAQNPRTLQDCLGSWDPEGAMMLQQGDTQRLLRALEVLQVTGKPLREHAQLTPLLVGATVLRIVLEPPRPVLRERIATRFDTMMQAGAIEEVEALMARDLDPSLPIMKALGVREIAAMLRGEISQSEARERTVIGTRQYAKRQSTWFRNKFGPDWRRVQTADEAVELVGRYSA